MRRNYHIEQALNIFRLQEEFPLKFMRSSVLLNCCWVTTYEVSEYAISIFRHHESTCNSVHDESENNYHTNFFVFKVFAHPGILLYQRVG